MDSDLDAGFRIPPLCCHPQNVSDMELTSSTSTSQVMEVMQLEISELCHQLRQLNQHLKKANDDDNDDDGEGGSNGKLTNFEKGAMKLDCKYGYMMNLFLQ